MKKTDRILKNEEKDLATISLDLEEGVKLGFFEKTQTEDGTPAYKITALGTAYVEAMPFETEREGQLWIENYKLKAEANQRRKR